MILQEQLRRRYGVTVNPLRTERRIELLVLILGLVLLLQLLYSGTRLVFGTDVDAIAPAGDALQVGTLRKVAVVETQDSAEVRGRPLFWDSRRPLDAVPPPVVVAEPEVSQAPQMKGVKLLGVFGSADATGIIVLVKNKKQRILQGEKLDGWTLQSVEPNRGVFSDGPRQMELVLKHGTIAAAAPVADAAEKATPAGKTTAEPGDSDEVVTPARPLPTLPAGKKRSLRRSAG